MTNPGVKRMDEILRSMDLHVPALSDAEWEQRDVACAERKRAEEARNREARLRERMQALHAAGHPERALRTIQRPDLDTSRPAIAHIRTWDPARTNILVLAGSVGTGKSVAATWWAAQQSYTPVYVTAMAFARQSRYDSRRDDLLAAPALILDDLGSEFFDAQGSFLVDLEELIDTFHREIRPLVITTNCTLEIFRERYRSRIFDRLRESGQFYAVPGSSLRGPARK